MKPGRIFMIFLLLGNLTAGRAETVELTGMASFFGQKMALLSIYQTAQTKPVSVTLSEGETSNGIQLLAIDFSQRNVQILNAGQRQTLHICGVTAETGAANGGRVVANGITIYHEDGTYEFQAHRTNALAGSAGQAMSPGGFAGASGSSTDPSTPSQADASSNDGNTPAPKQAKTYQWWVQEAEKIERARIETAARVKAGEWQPYPRTPLTPADTAAYLVSADAVFMDHGPGVVVSDN
ncbi:MAG: hypothetical protein P4N60_16935 [Verrucomicrobiae bacterium]|nr:hypothetical protein [Verrucomicrobiae bacterium]